MSIDYYIRLEQGRGPNPSRQVLSALARALMLTVDERDYLFRVAGESPPNLVGPSRELPRGIKNLLDSMVDIPAYVVDAGFTVLAWNSIARHFVGDLSKFGDAERNMIRWMFTRSDDTTYWSEEATLAFARSTVADLRAAYARYPGNSEIHTLVTELQAISPRFAEMWAEHQVAVRRAMIKRVVHPDLGPLEFECQILHIPDTDQRMIVYVPEPDSATAHAFRRLREMAPPEVTV